MAVVVLNLGMWVAESAEVFEGISMIDGTQRNSLFGRRIVALGDVNGDRVSDFAIAEPMYRLQGEPQERVHIFLGHRERRSFTADQFVAGGNIAGPGDVDGDGLADLLVTESGGESGEAARPRMVLYRGGPNGLDPKPAWSMPIGGHASAAFSMSGAGDLNGDGLGDFVVGIVETADGRGEVRVFLGRRALDWSGPDWTRQGEAQGEWFGDTVASAGDVNGDRFGDLLVAAPFHTQSNSTQGCVYLFAGSSTGPGTSAVWTATYPLRPRPGVDDRHEQFFGRHLASAGDVNGDGFADILIPACFAERNDPNEGLVFCYLGSRTGPGRKPAWTAESNRSHALFGWSVGSAGDVDLDGFDDVLIGAKHFQNGQDKEGVVALYRGSARGLERRPKWAFESNRSVDRTGDQVVGVGDVDGDGYRDVAVGSPGYHEPPGSEDGALGRVRIFFGSATGFAGDSGSRFDKPAMQWATEEWGRLSSGLRWFSLLAAAAGLFGAGLWTREAWRRRTIVLVESREKEGRLDERARIARDLHDELGSRLSRFNLIVERVRTDAVDPAATLRHSENLGSTARDLRTAIEQMAASLTPRGDTVEGFLDVIGRQAEGFFVGTDVRLRQDLPLDLPNFAIPGEVRVELVPCIREALNNALRHSGAREVWLRAVTRDRTLRIEIDDNGRGFDPAVTRAGGGLRNFRERMERIGGSCTVRGVPGAGTTVSFAIDVGPRASGRTPPGLSG